MKTPIQCHATDCKYNCCGECFHNGGETIIDVHGKCISFEPAVASEMRSGSLRIEKGTGSIGAEMVRRMISQYEGRQEL